MTLSKIRVDVFEFSRMEFVFFGYSRYISLMSCPMIYTNSSWWLDIDGLKDKDKYSDVLIRECYNLFYKELQFRKYDVIPLRNSGNMANDLKDFREYLFQINTKNLIMVLQWYDVEHIKIGKNIIEVSEGLKQGNIWCGINKDYNSNRLKFHILYKDT